MDIHNIFRKFKKDHGEHPNDSINTSRCLHDLQKESYDPIVYLSFYQLHDLDGEDFCLILQTKEMKETGERFDRVLTIDATHNTTQYGLKLITVMSIDTTYNTAYPVMFALCSNEERRMIRCIFRCLKERSRNLTPEILLSDDDNNCWNVASSIFPSIHFHYLCVWHVDKNWRRQIRKKIDSKDRQRNVYGKLCLLRKERSKEYFELMLNAFMEDIKQYISFHEYFLQYYFPKDRTLKWAVCFRDVSVCDTTTHIENFHRDLKHNHFHGKRNR